ncbi:MAG: 3-keto-5-aminohexanoate cleavage protein [Halobacteriales archaeon]
MAEPTDVHRNLYDDLEFADFQRNEVFPPEAAKEFFPVHREEPIETMDEPVIIESACPGWQPSGDHYPAVPASPEEVTQELIDSVEAGAAAIHVHPRNRNGNPQVFGEKADELLFETVEPVFEACGPVLTLQHTWAGGTAQNPHIDYVTGAQTMLERGDGNKFCQGALVLPPMRDGHSIDSVTEAVRFYQEHDITPIFQCYDSHVAHYLKKHLFDTGEVDPDDAPHIMNVNAGKHHSHAVQNNPWSFLQVITAKHNVEATFDDAIVNVYPGVRNWLAVYTMGLLLGGVVFRIGVEDAYWKYPHKDELIQKNAEAVELAVEIAEALGREVITDFDRARDYLGIEYTSPR